MASYRKPLPLPDQDGKPYWELLKQHKFSMQRCNDCGHYRFPPRHVCPNCSSFEAEWTEVSGRGSIHTFSIMHDNLVRGLDPPFVLAQVELDDQPGLRLICNIKDIDPKAVRIGMPVEVFFEDVTPEVTLPQFRPGKGT